MVFSKSYKPLDSYGSGAEILPSVLWLLTVGTRAMSVVPRLSLITFQCFSTKLKALAFVSEHFAFDNQQISALLENPVNTGDYIVTLQRITPNPRGPREITMIRFKYDFGKVK